MSRNEEWNFCHYFCFYGFAYSNYISASLSYWNLFTTIGQYVIIVFECSISNLNYFFIYRNETNVRLQLHPRVVLTAIWSIHYSIRSDPIVLLEIAQFILLTQLIKLCASVILHLMPRVEKVQNVSIGECEIEIYFG